jgi:glycosyltransferase involved in cell wall biosynthesis
LVRKYYRYFFPRFAKKASRIVTVSEFSKKDIQSQYKIDAEKIDVTLNGMNSNFRACSDEDIRSTKQRFSENEDYFLFIGSLQPRKNLVNMFKAFDLFKKEHPSKIKLLIVGEKKWWTKDISSAYQGMLHKNEVVFLGRLEPEDLCKALSSALALVYVSYFEGFGIPIIEAFRCGTAVITSNVTSMPEVAGDVALLVNPFSVTEISNAMSEITFNKELRDELIAKGQIRKDDFSWDITSQKLWESVMKTVNEKNSLQ